MSWMEIISPSKQTLSAVTQQHSTTVQHLLFDDKVKQVLQIKSQHILLKFCGVRKETEDL